MIDVIPAKDVEIHEPARGSWSIVLSTQLSPCSGEVPGSTCELNDFATTFRKVERVPTFA